MFIEKIKQINNIINITKVNVSDVIMGIQD